MRDTAPRLVLTFHTTAEAMAVERLCRKEGLAGRLISAPRRLTSDCGIAWCAPVESRTALLEALTAAGVEAAGVHELVL